MEWHEISRPQVHGYDLCSVSLVSSTLVSAAEEKVLRVFAPPQNFLHNFQRITGEELHCTEGVTMVICNFFKAMF